jgi:hypothetical protein
MKRFVVFMLLLLPASIHAQDVPLWPPDPASIFASGVEVLNVEIKAPHPYNPPSYDNETRIIRAYDEVNRRWQEFPYPNEVENFVYIAQRSPANTVELNTTLGGRYDNIPLPQGQWLLDTVTGKFSHPELACGELRDTAEHGHWVVQTQDNWETYFLCNTATEERVGSYSRQKYDSMEISTVSPDGKHVILFDVSDVYSYAFETDTLIKLGTSGGTDIQIATWIDNTRVFIYTTDQADMSFPWRNYSIADATKADSLDWIEQKIKPDEITTLDNPHRTQWVTRKDSNCFLTELNWETTEITDYDLDGLCSEGSIIPDGSNDRLYFEFNWPDDAFNNMGRPAKQPLSSKLVRYNPFTGKRLDLLKGEVEWVEEVSPDGHYAIVVTDDDGCFEAYPREDQFMDLPACEAKQASKPRHIVIDLKTGERMYEQPTEWEFNGLGMHSYSCYKRDTRMIMSDDYCIATLSAGPSDSLMFIDKQLLLQVVYHEYEPEYRLIDLRVDKPKIQVIGQAEGLRYLPASGQFLLTLNLPTTLNALGSSWALFDIATGKTIPLIQGISSDQYRIYIGDDTADIITVTLLPPVDTWINGQSDSVEHYIYTVRLPKSTD